MIQKNLIKRLIINVIINIIVCMAETLSVVCSVILLVKEMFVSKKKMLEVGREEGGKNYFLPSAATAVS